MLHFDSDYMEGAHPSILEALNRINFKQNPGYGTDAHCVSAKEKIRKACGCPGADVYFLEGGTQTNSTVITSLLRPWEGVLSADTGHVSLHEAGAIEYHGHKVLTIPNTLGKISASQVRAYMEQFLADANHDHMVFPGMVYISHPTEYGTLYTKEELEQLHSVCREFSLPLFLDGARLGYGLAAADTDITLETLAKTCDVFYIGGTKVGALFGEAVVVPDPAALPHFFTVIKQRGALLAKGWLLGLQFDCLFSENRYLNISRHALALAEKLKKAFLEKGYPLYLDSPTNQQFVILTEEQKEQLSRIATFGFWENLDDGRCVVRFATSWATKEEDIDALIGQL